MDYLNHSVSNNDKTENSTNYEHILSSDFSKSLGNIGLDSIVIAFALVITMFIYSILKHFINKIFTGENENIIAKFVITILLIAIFMMLCKISKH